MKVSDDDAVHDVDGQASKRDIKKASGRPARVKGVQRRRAILVTVESEIPEELIPR